MKTNPDAVLSARFAALKQIRTADGCTSRRATHCTTPASAAATVTSAKDIIADPSRAKKKTGEYDPVTPGIFLFKVAAMAKSARKTPNRVRSPERQCASPKISVAVPAAIVANR